MSDKGWVDQSEIDARLGYKIILAGLAEAGKTAVKRLFFLKHKTEDVDGLTATLSYERLAVTINKTPITILDLGGQRIFLKRFLTTFSPFIFNSVVTLVFLIDVSNRTARNNAVQYFKACLEKIEKYSPEAHIFVFLHKNDLVEHWPNYESIHEQLKEQFQIECKKQLRFFRTTIFNPKTVINSFGRIIELTMPELTNSEYVNGRTIGRIEEVIEKYTETPETLTELAAQIRKPMMKMADTEHDDPTYLERIQSIMRGSIVDKTTKPGSPLSPLSEAITEEMVEETSLTQIFPSKDQLSVQNIAQSYAKSEEDQINKQISTLIEFYGIDVEFATEVVNSGFSGLFKMATTAGVPINLVGDVIIKYIPFLKSKGLEIENISLDRLLDIFSSFLRGSVSEDNVFKCLIFATKKPKISIDDIILKYLAEPEVKVKKPPKKIISVPVLTVETEIPEGVINLPDTKGIGFKASIIENNAHLIFYCENRPVGRSKVSTAISIDGLIYLLSLEMNLHTLGLVTGGEKSINFAARIIHEALRQMREENLVSTAEIRGIDIGKILSS